MLILTIQNDGTGDVNVGNYVVQVLMNKRLLATGEVKGYLRVRGWKRLLSLSLKAIQPLPTLDALREEHFALAAPTPAATSETV